MDDEVGLTLHGRPRHAQVISYITQCIFKGIIWASCFLPLCLCWNGHFIIVMKLFCDWQCGVNIGYTQPCGAGLASVYICLQRWSDLEVVVSCARQNHLCIAKKSGCWNNNVWSRVFSCFSSLCWNWWEFHLQQCAAVAAKNSAWMVWTAGEQGGWGGCDSYEGEIYLLKNS